MMGFGQVVAVLMVLSHFGGLADGYSIVKYSVLSAVCLTALTVKEPRKGALTWAVILYLAGVLIACLYSGRMISFVGKTMNYSTGLLPCLIVAAVYHLSMDEGFDSVGRAFLVAVLLACALCAYKPQGDYFSGRTYAMMGSPVFLGGILAMAVPIALEVDFRALFAVLPVILLTQSRSALVASGVAVAAYYFRLGVISTKHFSLACLAAFVLFLGSFSGRNTSQSDLGRFHMFRVAGKAIQTSPWVGIGPERFGWAMATYRDKALESDMGLRWSNYYAHNQFLEALVSGGALLLILHSLLILAVGWFAWERNNPALIGVCAAVFTYSLFQPTPLAMKAILAALVGAAEPILMAPKLVYRASFALASFLALFFCAETLSASRIYYVAADFGNGNMLIDSYSHQPTAIGDQ